MPFTLGIRDRTLPVDQSSAATRFQQQGTIDWTNLGRTTISGSLEVLSRVSLAAIDPYTIAVSQEVAGGLQWSYEGQERFSQALQSSTCFPGYRQVLWFGFGVKHIIDVLTSTEEGARSVALGACLSECYAIPFSAGIMAEMAKACGSRIGLKPSQQQWKNLVESCAGVLAQSTFSVVAEQFMSLDKSACVANHAWTCQQGTRPTRSLATRAAIADALLGLIDLSRGHLQQMTLVGRSDGGFIAAIAVWLLGIRVRIRNEHEELYTNCQNGEHQLLVVYQSEGPEDALDCVGKTFRLPDAIQLIKSECGGTELLSVGGRVPWSHALKTTFGNDFEKLISMEWAFATALGSAARIFTALSESDPAMPPDSLKSWHWYFKGSSGIDYLLLARDRFPELEVLFDEASSTTRSQDLSTAIAMFEGQMAIISSACGCLTCCWKSVHHERPRPTGRTSSMYCLTVLIETVILLVRSLSGIVSGLLPMRSGLELVYDIQMSKHIEAKGRLSQIVPSFKSYQDPPLIYMAMTIFGGRTSIHGLFKQGTFCSAVSEHGLCYYLDILRESSRDAVTLPYVHVIPGKIEYLGRSYSILTDGGIQTPARSGSDRPRTCVPKSAIRDMTQATTGQFEVLVSEVVSAHSDSALTIEYGIVVGQAVVSSFGPARVIESFSANQGLVSCARHDCPPLPSLQDVELVEAQSQKSPDICRQLSLGQTTVYIIGGRLPTICLASYLLWDPLVRSGECLACCVRYGIQKNWRDFGIICISENLDEEHSLNHGRRSLTYPSVSSGR